MWSCKSMCHLRRPVKGHLLVLLVVTLSDSGTSISSVLHPSCQHLQALPLPPLTSHGDGEMDTSQVGALCLPLVYTK